MQQRGPFQCLTGRVMEEGEMEGWRELHRSDVFTTSLHSGPCSFSCAAAETDGTERVTLLSGASLNTAPSLARAAPRPLTPFATSRGEQNTEKTNKQTRYEGNEGGGNRDSLFGATGGTKTFPASRATFGAAYVAHLSHDGLLLLAEVVLVVLGDLLVQVLVHLQDLRRR